MKKREIEKELFKRIVPLEKYGLSRDLSWEKEEAIRIIKLLMNENVGILGGDVYNIQNDQFKPLYDNWSCERKEKESKEDFFLRSKKIALSYIENYSITVPGQVIFCLVFTEHFFEPIPDSEISTTAQILDENWLMCPDCVDAWESTSEDKIVICPKCDRAYYNPRYQPVEK
ncbi:MAG: hypothetical protein HKM07_03820 [Chlamydiae bacterium]|nr:hypothetical protein [Chlamydiota bacterium]